MEDNMKRFTTTTALLLTLIAFGASTALAQSTGTYQVNVTNLVPAQVFTPVLVATQNSSAALFTVGTAASAELQALAETGNVTPMTTLLNADTNVLDVQNSGGLHGPGNTAGIVVTGSDAFNWVSLAAMLIPTNDAFVSARTTLPAAGEVKVLYAYAYDAGTEINDESCASIPGPNYPECGGAGTGGSPGGGEGMVLIHSGIRGDGDFGRNRDWKNPVARITIRKVS
jgi:hypothetical protein